MLARAHTARCAASDPAVCASKDGDEIIEISTSALYKVLPS